MDAEGKLERLRDTRKKIETAFDEDRALAIEYPVFKRYKALSSFSSEQRICKEDEVYTAYDCGGDCIKFVFENGDMSFTKELFNRTMEAWKDVLEEVS